VSGLMSSTDGRRSACRGPVMACLYRIHAIARHQAIVMSRSPHRFFDILVQPVLTLLLYSGISLVAARGTTTVASLALFLIGGAILWNLVHQAQVSLASGAMDTLATGTLLDLMVSPLRMWEFMTGLALFGLVRTLVSTIATSLLGWAAFGFNVLAIGPWLTVAIALMLVSAWALALLVVGAVLRFGQGAEVLVWALMAALMPLSGAFYPIENLPGFLHPVAEILPFQHAFHLARGAAEHHVQAGDVLWGAAGAMLLLALTVGYLVAMTRIFLRRGYISRHF
jgi:ABC-2 type transport system permease protein